MRRGLEAPPAEGEEIWTGRVAALGRRLLRTDRYAAGSTGTLAGEMAETADVAGALETRGAPRAAGPAKGDGK